MILRLSSRKLLLSLEKRWLHKSCTKYYFFKKGHCSVWAGAAPSGGSPYRAWVISIHSFLACVHIVHLTQIDEASVEKLVAFLDINKMRKNPMVGKSVPYLSWKWYCLNVCLNVCLPQKSSKVNKEVEKPPTEEAPSFIRLQKNSSIQSICKSMAIFPWERV